MHIAGTSRVNSRKIFQVNELVLTVTLLFFVWLIWNHDWIIKSPCKLLTINFALCVVSFTIVWGVELTSKTGDVSNSIRLTRKVRQRTKGAGSNFERSVGGCWWTSCAVQRSVSKSLGIAQWEGWGVHSGVPIFGQIRILKIILDRPVELGSKYTQFNDIFTMP